MNCKRIKRCVGTGSAGVLAGALLLTGSFWGAAAPAATAGQQAANQAERETQPDPSRSRSSQDRSEHTGELVSVRSDSIAMTIDGKNRHSHRVTDRTQITVNGKPAQISELRPGDRITVTADENNVAQRIEADRRRPQSAESAAQREGERREAGDVDDVRLGAVIAAGEGEGVLIRQVAPNSPAAVAGLRPGDTIVAFDRTKVTSVEALAQLVERRQAGDNVEITFVREGQRAQATVRFVEQPDRRTQAGRVPQQSQSGAAWLGVRLEASEGRGVSIEDTYAGGPADEAGLRAGDRLLRIADQEVSSPEQASRTVRELSPGEQVEAVVLRNGREQSIQVTLGRRNRFFAQPPDTAEGRRSSSYYLGSSDHESLLMQHQDMAEQHERIERMLRELQQQMQQIQRDLQELKSQRNR